MAEPSTPAPSLHLPAPRHEGLRIAGQIVGADRGEPGNPDDPRRITVRHPYSGAVVGSVPKASLAEVRLAFDTAKAYRPTLSRADRAAILNRAGALVRERVDELAAIISAESG
ncbi:MAG: hypothetical protein RL375_3108, partial [Pseudomonadota bacterium]